MHGVQKLIMSRYRTWKNKRFFCTTTGYCTLGRSVSIGYNIVILLKSKAVLTGFLSRELWPTTTKALLRAVCMNGHHSWQSMDQSGKVANPARGQLNRENEISLPPFAPENLVSRDKLGRPVPRQPAHFPYSGWIWFLLTGFLPGSAAASI